jgi:hypothetical protein
VLLSHLAGSPSPAISALRSDARLHANGREGSLGPSKLLETGSTPAARFYLDARSLGKMRPNGAWRSLVAHSAGGRKVAGSNPVAPTSRNRRKSGGFVVPARFVAEAMGSK